VKTAPDCSVNATKPYFDVVKINVEKMPQNFPKEDE